MGNKLQLFNNTLNTSAPIEESLLVRPLATAKHRDLNVGKAL
jgi:hypothetical protein